MLRDLDLEACLLRELSPELPSLVQSERLAGPDGWLLLRPDLLLEVDASGPGLSSTGLLGDLRSGRLGDLLASTLLHGALSYDKFLWACPAALFALGGSALAFAGGADATLAPLAGGAPLATGLALGLTWLGLSFGFGPTVGSGGLPTPDEALA